MKTRKRGRALVSSAMVMIIVLVSWLVMVERVEAQQADRTLKIGVLTFRSGPVAPIGEEIYTGTQTAVAMYGPVLGRTVELIVEDSLANAQVAVTKATKLVEQQQVVAILGTSTVESLALTPVADRLRVPIITSNTGAGAITREKCNKWVFRTNPEEYMGVNALKQLIAKNPQLQSAKWFTLGSDYPWSRLVAGAVKGLPGLSYVGEAFAPADTTDWAPFVARARSERATALVIPILLGTPLLQFIQQATDFGLTKEAVLVGPIGLPDWTVDKLGPNVLRVISTSWGAWRYEERDPVARKFNEIYFKMHGRVAGMQAIQAGTAAMMLFSAIAKAGSTDGSAIVQALESVEVQTPVGMVRFQPRGRQAETPIFLGPYEQLKEPKYGAKFAQRIDEVLPASKTLVSAQESGCVLK